MYSVICADRIYSYKCLLPSYVKDNVKHVTRSAEYMQVGDALLD